MYEPSLQKFLLNFIKNWSHKLQNASITNLNLTNIIFKNVRFQETSFKDSLLINAKFYNCDFDNVVFNRVNLQNAEFYDCGFYGTKLNNVDLSKATLNKCFLENVYFTNVNLSNVAFDFSKTIDDISIKKSLLQNTSFESSAFRSAQFEKNIYANLKLPSINKFQNISFNEKLSIKKEEFFNIIKQIHLLKDFVKSFFIEKENEVLVNTKIIDFLRTQKQFPAGSIPYGILWEVLIEKYYVYLKTQDQLSKKVQKKIDVFKNELQNELKNIELYQ